MTSLDALAQSEYEAWWVVFSQRVRKVQSSQVPVVWEKEKINGPLGDWSSFC